MDEKNSRWRLATLLERAGVEPRRVRGSLAVDIESIVDDSRRVQRGSCFVAATGTARDGHDFVRAACESGAAAVVVSRSEVDVPAHVTVVEVDDTRVVLARLAAAWHGLRGGVRPIRLIGVTGTNGKSTVAWLVRSILRAANRPCALFGTIEYDVVSRLEKAPLTTPGSLALSEHLACAFDAGARHAVMEVSSHALEQRRCDGLAFGAAAFTNLTGDHLDYHRTMEAYFAAKRRLFDLLEPGGAAIINVDDPWGMKLAASLSGPAIRFGLDAVDVDVRASIRSLSRSGCDVELRGRAFAADVRLPLIGRHNVMNALTAAALAEAMGVPGEAIVAGLESTANVPGRLQRVEPRDWPYSVIVDYAHTDAALDNVLAALRPITSGRVICVFGCGGNRDRTKRPRMAAAVERGADLAIVTSDNPRGEEPQAIMDEILTGFSAKPRCGVLVEADRAVAIERAIAEARSGDTVLIAGKGHEDYQIVGDRVHYFDDAMVAAACLARASARGAAA